MSWWDYGYQITAIANRTVLVDNNTWNNTHIGRVGQAMASSEEEAYEILRELDVDYILVIFGGASSYSSDGKAFFARDHLEICIRCFYHSLFCCFNIPNAYMSFVLFNAPLVFTT